MSARYVNESGVLVHDTFQPRPTPDLRLVDGSELQRLPAPDVVELDPPCDWTAAARAQRHAVNRSGAAADLVMALMAAAVAAAVVIGWLA
jgi:hypothetical protein